MKQTDIDFLKNLQHELNTQDNCGNAEPVFWGIMEKTTRACPDGCGDLVVYYGPDHETEMDITGVIEMVNERNEFSNDVFEEWLDIQKNRPDEIIEFLNDHGFEITAGELAYDYKLSTDTGAFLTLKAAREYLEKFGYNHPKGSHTFAMTAFRNFELERLLNIIKTMDFNLYGQVE